MPFGLKFKVSLPWWFVCVLSMTTIHLQAGYVIDPAGEAYTNVSASSEYSSAFAAANLFSHDMTGVNVGAVIEPVGVDWAISGTGPGFVSFQLGQVHDVESVFYAQRIGGDPHLDKISQISLWASINAPFSAADPGTPPQATVTITNQDSGVWIEYFLSAGVTGRYFLIKVEQNPVSGGNIGGNELRLGSSGPDPNPPAVISLNPAAGATVQSLNSIQVGFSKPVAGVDASDLLINGLPSTNLVSVSPNAFTFYFPQPSNGLVQAAWVVGNGIHDLTANSNTFAGGSWSYFLNTNLPHLVISEFMATNQNTVQDEDGEASPWIEIFNPTTNDVNLAGWALTDDPNNLMQWRFPNITILGCG